MQFEEVHAQALPRNKGGLLNWDHRYSRFLRKRGP